MALRALHLSHLPVVLPREQPALDTAPENLQGSQESVGPQVNSCVTQHLPISWWTVSFYELKFSSAIEERSFSPK